MNPVGPQSLHNRGRWTIECARGPPPLGHCSGRWPTAPQRGAGRLSPPPQGRECADNNAAPRTGGPALPPPPPLDHYRWAGPPRLVPGVWHGLRGVADAVTKFRAAARGCAPRRDKDICCKFALSFQSAGGRRL